MKKKKKALWVGYLDAGERSSPVVRDPSLDTGNPATIYLFNLMRGRILEYRKEIVERKLREFSPEECSMVKIVQDAFREAKKEFSPRGGRRSAPSPIRKQILQPESDIPEIPEVGDNDTWMPIDEDSPSPHSAEFSD